MQQNYQEAIRYHPHRSEEILRLQQDSTQEYNEFDAVGLLVHKEATSGASTLTTRAEMHSVLADPAKALQFASLVELVLGIRLASATPNHILVVHIVVAVVPHPKTANGESTKNNASKPQGWRNERCFYFMLTRSTSQNHCSPFEWTNFIECEGTLLSLTVAERAAAAIGLSINCLCSSHCHGTMSSGRL